MKSVAPWPRSCVRCVGCDPSRNNNGQHNILYGYFYIYGELILIMKSRMTLWRSCNDSTDTPMAPERSWDPPNPKLYVMLNGSGASGAFKNLPLRSGCSRRPPWAVTVSRLWMGQNCVSIHHNGYLCHADHYVWISQEAAVGTSDPRRPIRAQQGVSLKEELIHSLRLCWFSWIVVRLPRGPWFIHQPLSGCEGPEQGTGSVRDRILLDRVP